MSKPLYRKKDIIDIEIPVKSITKRNINNWRMIRFENDYQYLIAYCELIENYILSKYEKKKSIFDDTEFELLNTLTLDNRIKKQKKIKEIYCRTKDFEDFATFRYSLKDDYGYIKIIGTHENGIYTFGPRLIWYPNGWYHPYE